MEKFEDYAGNFEMNSRNDGEPVESVKERRGVGAASGVNNKTAALVDDGL